MEVTMNERIINELISTAKYCSVYYELESPKLFSFGKIVASDKKHLLLKAYLPNGDYDGLQLIDCDSVFKIEYDDLYCKCMKSLIKEDLIDISIPNEDVCHNFIEYCFDKQLLVSISVSEDEWDAVGFVYSTKGRQLTIQKVDEYGRKDGYVVIEERSIVYARCFSAFEQKISILNKALF